MRKWLTALVAAAVVSGLGVSINLATDTGTNVWAWVAVVVLTVATAVITVRFQTTAATGFQTTAATTSNVMSGSAQNVVQAGQIGTLIVGGSANRDDVETLRQVTDANLEALADHSGLPVRTGRAVVHRSEAFELLSVEGGFVITGEPGSGKTGALHQLATHLLAQGEDAVLLTVETMGEAVGAVRGDVALTHALREVLTEWPGEGRGTLLIDGVDASRRESLTWLANLVIDLRGSRWRTVATMRRFDLRFAAAWRKAFTGEPISASSEHRDEQLADVQHFVLGDFSVAELQQLAVEDPGVRALVDHADEQFLRLIRNPFNLRLAYELLPGDQAGARDQLDLLQRYWNKRVLAEQDAEQRARVLTVVCQAMLANRKLRASTSVVPDTLLDARLAVLRDGVLREIPGRLLATGPPALVFSHHILFDYAVAALVLAEDDRSRLRDALDEDSNLVLVARPSMDLHLAAVWHADPTRQEFAEVMNSLAESDHGVAAIAAAAVLVAEAREESDLRWLVEQPDGPEYVSRITAVVGWIAGVMSAADDRLKERIRSMAGPWTSFVADVVSRLVREFDNQLASQTFQLLRVLEELQPLGPGVPGAEERARCLAQLMTSALERPDERHWLAPPVSRYLPQAARVRAEHADLIRRTLDPGIMRLWPTTYLNYYVDGIAAIAEVDPALAEEVLLAIWNFRDDSDAVTPLLQGIVSMTSTRKQDVEHLKWMIGQRFAGYLAVVGLRNAVPVLAAVTDLEDPQWYSGEKVYPIVVGAVSGRVDVAAGSLSRPGDRETPLKVLNAFAGAMRTAQMSSAAADGLVADVVASIRHPQAWRRMLLAAAENPDVLGRAFGPALLAGGLFWHYETHAGACTLVKAVAPQLSDAEHGELEAAILAFAAAEPGTMLVDQLIGSLDSSRIQLPEVAERLTRLTEKGGPPAIDVDDDEIGELLLEPTTLRDYLGTAYNDLGSVERDVLNELRRAIDLVNGSTADPDSVDKLENAFRHAVEVTKDLFTRTPDHAARELVLWAAEELITKRHPGPATPLGELIIGQFLAMDESAHDDETGEQR